MNRLIKNLNAFQHEMRKGYEQELELKQINSVSVILIIKKKKNQPCFI